MATTQNETLSGTGSVTGTVKPHPTEYFNLKIRSFVLWDGLVSVNGYNPKPADRLHKSLQLTFRSDISNGKHDFSENGPIETIYYKEGVLTLTEYFDGIKNGKGYVDITFNREAGTLQAKIVNVGLKEKDTGSEITLNAVFEAKELLDHDSLKN